MKYLLTIIVKLSLLFIPLKSQEQQLPDYIEIHSVLWSTKSIWYENSSELLNNEYSKSRVSTKNNKYLISIHNYLKNIDTTNTLEYKLNSHFPLAAIMYYGNRTDTIGFSVFFDVMVVNSKTYKFDIGLLKLFLDKIPINHKSEIELQIAMYYNLRD